MVEFALTFPIFLMLVYGIFEVGRMIFMYSAVLNASRDAARYAAASGVNEDGVQFYRDCDGIKSRAERVSGFVDLSATDAIMIAYDHGPVTGAEDEVISPFASCPLASGTKLNYGDRVIVKIDTTFEPIAPIPHLTEIPIVASTTRSVVTDVNIWTP